jgi:hypothetical protein
MPSQQTCFKSGEKDSEVRRYFEKRRGGFLRQRDEVKSIEARYAPVGAFALDWEEETDSGLVASVKKTNERSNVFYINLSSGVLYYVRRGLFDRTPFLGESDIMERLIDIPPKALEFLADIFKKGKIGYSDLNKKHFLFLDGNPDMLMMLRARELIAADFSAYGSREYSAKIGAPAFSSRRYDLGKSIPTEEKTLKEEDMDEPKHSSEMLLNKLKTLLSGEGKFAGIVYLPYQRCRYVDKSGGFRELVRISPKFSASA